jgi:hypothetical protein
MRKIVKKIPFDRSFLLFVENVPEELIVANPRFDIRHNAGKTKALEYFDSRISHFQHSEKKTQCRVSRPRVPHFDSLALQN